MAACKRGDHQHGRTGQHSAQNDVHLNQPPSHHLDSSSSSAASQSTSKSLLASPPHDHRPSPRSVPTSSSSRQSASTQTSAFALAVDVFVKTWNLLYVVLQETRFYGNLFLLFFWRRLEMGTGPLNEDTAIVSCAALVVSVYPRPQIFSYSIGKISLSIWAPFWVKWTHNLFFFFFKYLYFFGGMMWCAMSNALQIDWYGPSWSEHSCDVAGPSDPVNSLRKKNLLLWHFWG